jgi:hypothetical protein
LLLYFVLFVASTSVTQDDYATLSDLSLDGFWGPTNGVWDVLGGNISSVIPRTLALSVGFFPILPIGLVTYSALTLLLIMLSIDYLLGLFVTRYKDFPVRTRVPLALILNLGFEGLFTPGELGVLGFSAAAGVHIWPVCFIVLGHKLFQRKSLLNFLGTILAFVYAGNSNIPEGALATLVVISLTYRSYFASGNIVSKKRSAGNLVLVFTTLISLLIIFSAPGFQARTDTAGVSLDPRDLVTGIVRAGIFFSADILTHPFIYLAGILGYLLGRATCLQVDMKRIHEFSLFAFLYFLLLVIGAGVAYPAWHQTFGLYIFLLPLAFSFGLLYSAKMPQTRAFVSALLGLMLVLCVLVTLRSGYTVFERKLSWQSNFEHNVCLVREGVVVGLRGSQITYPPNNLGIEDVDSWPWMADGFKNWIIESGFSCTAKRF